MNARAFTIPHRIPQMSMWRVVVDRPESEGGTFFHDFKGNDAAFYAAQMASRWRLYGGRRKRFTYKHPLPEDWSASLDKLRLTDGTKMC